MGQARGTITQEELEKYGGANIMLMNTGDGMQSSAGGVAGGEVTWGIRWNNEGITGAGWYIDILNRAGAGLAPDDITGAESFLDNLNNAGESERGYWIWDRLMDVLGWQAAGSCLFK